LKGELNSRWLWIGSGSSTRQEFGFVITLMMVIAWIGPLGY
jgi:hypothetical protein